MLHVPVVNHMPLPAVSSRFSKRLFLLIHTRELNSSRTTTTFLLLLLSLSLVLVLLLLLHPPLLPLAVLAYHGFRNSLGLDASRAVAQVLSSVFWLARTFCRSALHELVAGGAVGVDEVFGTHLDLFVGGWV